MSRPTSETAIKTAILKALNALPWVEIRNNKQVGRGYLRGGLGTGTSDLIGILTTVDGVGVYLAIEVKRDEKEEPSKAQVAFIEDVRRRGGVAECVHSVEGALEVVRLARGEQKRVNVEGSRAVLGKLKGR